MQIHHLFFVQLRIFSFGAGFNFFRGDSLRNQVILSGFSAPFAERLVIFHWTSDIGMTDNHQLVLLCILLVILKGGCGLGQNAFLAGNQAYFGMAAFRIGCWVKEAGKRNAGAGSMEPTTCNVALRVAVPPQALAAVIALGYVTIHWTSPASIR